MINRVPIIIDERGSVKKDISILAMENENLSKTFSILLPNSILDKWLYIEFEKADGTKFVSPRLTATGGYIEYNLGINLLDQVGKLICQVVAKNGEKLVWKSNKFDFSIPSSINATEEVVEANPDILADLQNQINNIEVGGGSSTPENVVTTEEFNTFQTQVQEMSLSLTNMVGDVRTELVASDENLQTQITDLASRIDGAAGSSAKAIVEITGSSVTLEPNTHTVITGVTNKVSIGVSEVETTEAKNYSFEFTSIDRIPSVTFTNVTAPYNFEYGRYKGYIGEIINNKVCYKTIYDAYPYQFIYGTYASADWASSYNFKNDLTVTKVSGSTVTGTYSISLDSDIYSIYIEYDDETSEYIVMTDQGTFTVNSVVYTKA